MTHKAGYACGGMPLPQKAFLRLCPLRLTLRMPRHSEEMPAVRANVGMRLRGYGNIGVAVRSPESKTRACECTYRRRTALSNAQNRKPVTAAHLVGNRMRWPEVHRYPNGLPK